MSSLLHRRVNLIIVCIVAMHCSVPADSNDLSRPVQAQPPVRFRCDGDPPLAFTVTFDDREPGSVVVEHHGRRITMQQQPMASGIRYTADEASYSEHQGEARITWPGLRPALRCLSH